MLPFALAIPVRLQVGMINHDFAQAVTSEFEEPPDFVRHVSTLPAPASVQGFRNLSGERSGGERRYGVRPGDRHDPVPRCAWRDLQRGRIRSEAERRIRGQNVIP